jgi:hypothetical protein
VSFEGKRVAVIGTGATGIQAITEIAKTAGHLTVFQRTAQWSAPLHNTKVTPEEMRDIRKNYADIFARCQETVGCFIHAADPRSALEVTKEEREAFWEKRYGEPGFGIWMGNFRNVLLDRYCGLELDVASEVEFVGNVVQIPQDHVYAAVPGAPPVFGRAGVTIMALRSRRSRRWRLG